MSERRVLKWDASMGLTRVLTGDVPHWLAVGFQGHHVVAWCEATVGSDHESFLLLVPTGEPAPSEEWAYVGTAQHPTLLDGTPLVLHVYHKHVT